MKYFFYDCGCFDKNEEPVDRVKLYVPTETKRDGFDIASKWLSRLLKIPEEGVHITGVSEAEEDGKYIKCVYSMLNVVPVGRRKRNRTTNGRLL